MPGYGYVLGCRAFSLEESHQFGAAEPMGRLAVEIAEDDVWAVCVAHVLEGQGRRQDGIQWIDEHEEAWKRRGIFAAIFGGTGRYYLELGPERFDDGAQPLIGIFKPTEDNIDLTDASSMLMHLDMLGVDVGDRWESVGAICAGPVKDRLRPFNDLHFVMALTHSGRMEAAREILASMRDFVAANDGAGQTVVEVYKQAGIPIAEAIIDHTEGKFARVVEIMSSARYRMVPLGGSGQRDVWVRILIDAAIKDGQYAYARALLAERTRCPSSGPSWNMYADALAAEKTEKQKRHAPAVAKRRLNIQDNGSYAISTDRSSERGK